MKQLILLSITILAILSSCIKDDLKPEDYKFYCKVDGVEWKRTTEGGSCPGCTPLKSEYYPNGSRLAPPGKLEIIAHRDIESKGIRHAIYIYIKRLKGEGEYIQNVSKRNIFINHNDMCVSIEGHTLDTNFINSFVVTNLDTIARSIKGTFDFRVVNYKCIPPDTIRMTEGHFNLRPTWHR